MRTVAQSFIQAPSVSASRLTTQFPLRLGGYYFPVSLQELPTAAGEYGIGIIGETGNTPPKIPGNGD